MSGLDTQTHTHTHTQDDYRNPRCACAPRVNNYRVLSVIAESLREVGAVSPRVGV